MLTLIILCLIASFANVALNIWLTMHVRHKHEIALPPPQKVIELKRSRVVKRDVETGEIIKKT